MLLGIVAFSSVEANAQYRNRDDRRDDRYERRDDRRNDRYGNSNGGYYTNNIYRVAQQNGYRDGLRQGREDRRDRDRYNPQKARDYKNAMNGYNSRFGSKNDYKTAYRQAFINGYNQGYNGGRNNNGYYGY